MLWRQAATARSHQRSLLAKGPTGPISAAAGARFRRATTMLNRRQQQAAEHQRCRTAATQLSSSSASVAGHRALSRNGWQWIWLARFKASSARSALFCTSIASAIWSGPTCASGISIRALRVPLICHVWLLRSRWLDIVVVVVGGWGGGWL